MKIIKSLSLLILIVGFLSSFRIQNEGLKVRTEGYYFTYDTIENTVTKEQRIRFYPIVFFEDSTLSDFYFQHSREEFEKLLNRKKYKWIKKFSDFGSYRIVSDSIYIHEKTWTNKLPDDSGKDRIVDAFIKGIILNDSTIEIVENIFMGDTIRQSTIFQFTRFEFKK